MIHSLSQQIQPISISTQINMNRILRRKFSRRDIRLLLHTIFMFSMFILGWGPIFTVLAIDYQSKVPPFVYTLLIILAEISFLCDIINLFYYNQTLRDYLRNLIYHCTLS